MQSARRAELAAQSKSVRRFIQARPLKWWPSLITVFLLQPKRLMTAEDVFVLLLGLIHETKIASRRKELMDHLVDTIKQTREFRETWENRGSGETVPLADVLQAATGLREDEPTETDPEIEAVVTPAAQAPATAAPVDVDIEHIETGPTDLQVQMTTLGLATVMLAIVLAGHAIGHLGLAQLIASIVGVGGLFARAGNALRVAGASVQAFAVAVGLAGVAGALLGVPGVDVLASGVATGTAATLLGAYLIKA
jgi:hypothetical protein